jgi:endonuclease YncB( thermonuclease family)
MARFGAICTYVDDGDTFQTAKGEWIRLANVCVPDSGEDGYAEAKKILSVFILNMKITYEQVRITRKHIVAEVWIGEINVNEYMRRKGYTNLVDLRL